MRDFKRLKVWEKAHQLTVEVYGATKTFPREELYGLTSQIRRASTSVPTNIAEGCGRTGERELARFLQISMGSASELEYQFLLAYDLKHLKKFRLRASYGGGDRSEADVDVVDTKAERVVLVADS